MNFHYFSEILSFAGQALWPIVVIIVFLYLKSPIKKFLENIRKLSYGDYNLEAVELQKENSKTGNLSNIQDQPSQGPRVFFTDSITHETREELLNVIVNETQIDINVPDISNFETLKKYTMLLILSKYFDQIYNVIFGSQIALLKILNNSSNSKQKLKYLYDNAVSSNPDFFSNYPYTNYLQFLIDYKLITYDHEADLLNITPLGQDFLKYLDFFGFSINKPN